MIHQLIKWVKDKIEKRNRKKRFMEKLEELRKRDPFIYNH